MATPTTIVELPTGVLRASFGSRVVLLVDSNLPFSHNEEIMKLTNTMSAIDIIFRYWVFSVAKGAFDRNEKNFTITLPNPHLVKSAGYNTYEGAEAKYEEWAKTDSEKTSIAKGLEWIMNSVKRED